MTDTQREPKPGEWWEAKAVVHNGTVQCLVVEAPAGTGDRLYALCAQSGHVMQWHPSWFVRFLGKTVDLTPPAPPAKKLRAWTYGDALVRFDALFRRSGSIVIYRLQAVRPVAVELFEFTVPFDALLESWEHSTDSGRTWQPCGVEE